MVGRDEVDRSVAESLPELIAIFAAANWRGALEKGCASGDCFGSEMQVVRAGFDGYGKAFGACGAQFGKGFGGGEMDDVEAKFTFAAEGEEHSNGGEFGFFGARLEIGFIERPVGVG